MKLAKLKMPPGRKGKKKAEEEAKGSTETSTGGARTSTGGADTRTSTTGNRTKTGGSNPGGASTGGAGTVTITTGSGSKVNIGAPVGGRTAAKNGGGMDPNDKSEGMMDASTRSGEASAMEPAGEVMKKKKRPFRPQ